MWYAYGGILVVVGLLYFFYFFVVGYCSNICAF